MHRKKWPFTVKKWHQHKFAILIAVFVFTPVFRTLLYVFKVHNGLIGSLPVHADQWAIGCLLALLTSRLPKIGKGIAGLMLVVMEI